MKHRIFLGVVSVILVVSCNKKKDDANPCADVQAIYTDFKIEEVVSHDFKISTDTALVGNDLLFSYVSNQAAHSYYSYYWTVNNVPIGSNQVATTWFDKPGDYTIALLVKRHPIYNCAPYDSGSYLVKKNLVIVARPEINLFSTPLVGKFYGHTLLNPGHNFTLEIGKFPFNQDSTDYFIGINNFPEDCTNKYFGDMGKMGYRGFEIGDLGSYNSDCSNFGYGVGILSGDGITLNITYYKLLNNIRIEDKFTGIKL